MMAVLEHAVLIIASLNPGFTGEETRPISSCDESTDDVDVVFYESFSDPVSPIATKLNDHPHLAIIKDGDELYLRATYVGNEQGSERISVRYPLDQKASSMTLSYDLRFSPDFDFVKGGKLPGIGSKNAVSGGRTGGPTQWSVRPMWRTDGRPVSYTYYPSRPGIYGVDNPGITPIRFEPGQWHHLTLQVQLNSSDQAANGSVTLYIDGELAGKHDDLILRGDTSPESEIQTFLFSTFFGGHTDEWAPKSEDGQFRTLWADFDNILLQEGICF